MKGDVADAPMPCRSRPQPVLRTEVRQYLQQRPPLRVDGCAKVDGRSTGDVHLARLAYPIGPRMGDHSAGGMGWVPSSRRLREPLAPITGGHIGSTATSTAAAAIPIRPATQNA